MQYIYSTIYSFITDILYRSKTDILYRSKTGNKTNIFLLYTQPFRLLFRVYTSITLHSETSQYSSNNLLISFKFTLNTQGNQECHNLFCESNFCKFPIDCCFYISSCRLFQKMLHLNIYFSNHTDRHVWKIYMLKAHSTITYVLVHARYKSNGIITINFPNIGFFFTTNATF